MAVSPELQRRIKVVHFSSPMGEVVGAENCEAVDLLTNLGSQIVVYRASMSTMPSTAEGNALRHSSRVNQVEVPPTPALVSAAPDGPRTRQQQVIFHGLVARILCRVRVPILIGFLCASRVFAFASSSPHRLSGAFGATVIGPCDPKAVWAMTRIHGL